MFSGRRAVTPILAGAGAASAVVAAGTATPESRVLATITGGAFAELVWRVRREDTAGGDTTDIATGLAFLAILVGAAFDVGRGSVATPNAWFSRSLGAAVIALGLVLRYWAERTLGTSFAMRLCMGEDHRLVEDGPYRWIRHPNYLALLVIAAGTAFGLSSPLATAATLFVWLPVVLVRIAREERMLRHRYGDVYDGYRRRSWCMVPGIY